MGNTARRAADTFTMQEWAARLATRAPSRDYVAQLRELYRGILDRWRYVMEPGERVPGSPRALLGFVLGANYNGGPTCPNPERCDVTATKWRERGWGDCDDVSTLAAAGVLALGMVPVWRVVEWPNGAHVSTVARTPRGESVSIDPVGHPSRAFGWAMDPPGGRVRFFDLTGRPIGAPAVNTKGPANMGSTYLDGLDGFDWQTRRRRRTARPMFTKAPHVAVLPRLAPRGARLLAVPAAVQRAMLSGYVYDRAPAIDQFGQQYEYVAGADVWAPLGAWYCPGAGQMVAPMGARGSRRKRRRARRARIFKKVRKIVGKVAKTIGKSRIAKFYRKVKAKILGSKLVQGLASRVLNVFGIPAAATKAIMAREADLAKRGGRSKLIELAAAGKMKEAAKMMAAGFKAGGKAAMPGSAIRGALKSMRGVEQSDITNQEALIAALSGCAPGSAAMGQITTADYLGMSDDGTETVMYQDGGAYSVAPIAGIYSAESMMGDLDTMDVRDTPTPGAWYQIRKGDTLLGVTGKAYGVGSGGTRLKLSQRLNAAPYNMRFWSAPQSDFGKKYYRDGVIALLPKFDAADAQRLDSEDGTRGDGGQYPAIWIPSDSQEDAPPLPLPMPEPPEPEPEPPEPIPPIVLEPEICPPGSERDPSTGECATFAPQPTPGPTPGPVPPYEPPTPLPPVSPEEPDEPPAPEGCPPQQDWQGDFVPFVRDSRGECIPSRAFVPSMRCPPGHIQSGPRCVPVGEGPQPVPDVPPYQEPEPEPEPSPEEPDFPEEPEPMPGPAPRPAPSPGVGKGAGIEALFPAVAMILFSR